MKITRSEYATLTWAESQAKENLGAHTGGPNETAYQANLKSLRAILLKIKRLTK